MLPRFLVLTSKLSTCFMPRVRLNSAFYGFFRLTDKNGVDSARVSQGGNAVLELQVSSLFQAE